MFDGCVCGSFSHEEEEDVDEFWINAVTFPKKSRSKKKDSKNPYSTRGLDQFSALLAELEEKRQQIYSQMGTQGIVRFVYKNSNDCVPIVVKLNKVKKYQIRNKPSPDYNTKKDYVSDEVVNNNKIQTPSELNDEKKKKKKSSFSWNVYKLQNLRRPSYYIPSVIVLILFLLLFFGRSVAILCTCIGWYIVPAIRSSSGEGSNFRTSMKKKDYVKKFSGKSSSPME